MMGGEAGDDGRVVAAEEPGDLEQTVVAFRVVAQQPPDLLSSARHTLGSRAPGEQIARDAAVSADVVDEREEISRFEVADDLGGAPEDTVPSPGGVVVASTAEMPLVAHGDLVAVEVDAERRGRVHDDLREP